MDNEIDRKVDITLILFLMVQNRQQTMTEPWLDQALMDSAYRSEAFLFQGFIRNLVNLPVKNFYPVSCLIISLFWAISSFLPISPSSVMSGLENFPSFYSFSHLIHSSNVYFIFSFIEFFLLKIFFVLSICHRGQKPY